MSEQILGALYGYTAGAAVSMAIDAAFGDPEEEHGSIPELLFNLGLELVLLGALAFPVIEVLNEAIANGSDITGTSASMFFIVGMTPGLGHLDAHTKQLVRVFKELFTEGSIKAEMRKEKE